MRACVDGDRGVATVWAAGAIAVLVSMAVSGYTWARRWSSATTPSLPSRSRRASGGCDCRRRRAVRLRPGSPGHRPDASATDILPDARRDVLVDVAAHPDGWLGGLGAATGRARAGPAAP